jgi:hypothetical protein
VAAAACASGPPNRVAEGHEGAPGVRRILPAPPNLVLALHSEIQSGSRPVDEEIVTHLLGQDREVERFSLLEGRRLWKQAVAEAKASRAQGGAVAIFVRELARSRDFDVLALPSLILHQTQMDANNASWDGVSRRMRVANARTPASGRHRAPTRRGSPTAGSRDPPG